MTAAGVYEPAPGAAPAPALGPGQGWLRLAWLYLVSRRAPGALALLAGFGVLLWAALFWHWNIAGGGAGTPAQQVVQAALLEDAGTPLAAQPNVLGFSPWALPGNGPGPATSYPPQISTAAQRFAALPAAARHAWFSAHLGALRAGHITFGQLP